MKKALSAVFVPRGYLHTEPIGPGGYQMRKTTARNNTVELSFDVGTGSRSVLAHLSFRSMYGGASIHLPVSKHDPRVLQYPIIDFDQWTKIVENMAVSVDYLERTFVSEMETVCGCTPKWYRNPHPLVHYRPSAS